MANPAHETVVPIRPDLRAVEQRVADLDEGYAKLSNMLLEEYAGADLTKRQFKVLLAVLRKTYGWNKPMDRISDSQIAEIAKLPVKRCNEAKLELVRMGLLKQQGGMFGPNKNVSEWRIPQNEGKSPKLGDKTSLKLRESNPSKQGDTKDTITKDKKDINPTSENSHESSDGRLQKFLSCNPEAAVYTPTGSKWGTADDLKAAQWIYGMVLKVSPTAKEPGWPDWANAVRLLRNAKQVTHHDICALFKWANADSFWHSNVLSPAKLREKWDTLTLQQTQKNRQQRPDAGSVSHWNDRQAWEEEFI